RILMEETDIDTVYLSRTNDSQQVGLSQRTDDANRVAADHFHSIHSNAGPPEARSIFVLWPQLISGAEPSPPYNGGRRWSELMGQMLGRSMRAPLSNRGAWGECDFYGASSCRSTATTPKGSRNFVQSFSLMPSALSEASFHTNPTQNQRNMNADWKRLEARAMFWSILQYFELERPAKAIATGIIADAENDQPINGATITIGDQTYTTDTFESLFNQYSPDPSRLRNGFYYLDALPGPGTYPVTVTAEGFRSLETTVAVSDTFFTFADYGLFSTVAPSVTETIPVADDDNYRLTDPLTVAFSRPMDRNSVEQAASLSPSQALSFAWNDESTRLTIDPDTLLPRTAYTLTLASTAQGALGDPFDGNADGTPGDAFTLSFTTSFPDTAPPRIAGARLSRASDVELRPVVTVTYSERIKPESAEGRIRLEETASGQPVSATVELYEVEVGDVIQSVVTIFPEEDLRPETSYRYIALPGLEDDFLNQQPDTQQFTFTTSDQEWVATEIDSFDEDFDRRWWVPQQSGSTTGIVTEATDASADDSIVNLLTDSELAMRLDYGWDTQASAWLIREFLNAGPPFELRFQPNRQLQAYVFGDGSGNQIRFAVDDGLGTASAGTEVSPWFTIDWLGWNVVSWDMASGEVGSWIGDGTLDGTLRFDSIQLTYVPGSPAFGSIWIDDLRLVEERTVVDIEDDGPLPEVFALDAAYPNPFASTTTLRFSLPEAADVTLSVYNVLGAEVARLVSGQPHAAGRHMLTWNASGLASGVYVVEVRADRQRATQKVLLVR
ncbi:MAG: Ig-like domain-containing protein, partial [Bacteroidota bacterium]